MNSNSGMNLDNLINANMKTVETLKETPYQPTVMAIPKEHWQAMLGAIRAAVNFQPTLYSQISNLATWKDVQDKIQDVMEIEGQYMNKTVNRLTEANNHTVLKLEEKIEQAGKNQEKNFSEYSEILDRKIEKMEKLSTKLKRYMLIFLISTSTAAALLSTVLCLLLAH